MDRQVDFGMMSNVQSAGFREQVRPLAIAATELSELLPEAPILRKLGKDIVAGSTRVIAAPAGAIALRESAPAI